MYVVISVDGDGALSISRLWPMVRVLEVRLLRLFSSFTVRPFLEAIEYKVSPFLPYEAAFSDSKAVLTD